MTTERDKRLFEVYKQFPDSLLAAMILHPHLIWYVETKIKIQDWYDEHHILIYEIILEREFSDLMSFSGNLAHCYQNGKSYLDLIGGHTFFWNMVANCPPFISLRLLAYKDYLKSEHWKKLKREYFLYSEKKCLICGAEQYIHLHHRTYKRLGFEAENDIVPLCKKCHAFFHQNSELSEEDDNGPGLREAVETWRKFHRIFWVT